MLNHHKEEAPDFIYKLDKQWKTSLSRQIGEALCISKADPATLMNSKSEWGSNRIPRVVVEDKRPPPNPEEELQSLRSPRPVPAGAAASKRSRCTANDPLQQPSRPPNSEERRQTAAPPPTVIPRGDLRLYFASKPQPTNSQGCSQAST